MGLPNKDRGEYRPIYEALFHSPEYLALPADSRLILVTLKCLCGAIGVKSWPGLDAALTVFCGLSPKRVRIGLQKLESDGWVERDGAVVWIVNGLKFEPQISQGQKHQVYVQKRLDELPKCALLDRFRVKYAAWLSDSPSDTPSDTPCDTTTPTPTPIPTPTPTSSSSRTAAPPLAGMVADVIDAIQGIEHADAVQRAIRAAQHPHALAAELQAMAGGMRGSPIPWDVICRAVHELQVSGGRLSARSLRAFAEQLVHNPLGGGDDEWDQAIARMNNQEPEPAEAM